MIEACELTRYYGARAAVRDVSFFIGDGETVGFLGANGAGKSTTMRMLTGFLAPSSGEALIGGVSVTKNPLTAKRLFGYLPENTPLYTEMRVGEYLRFRAELKGVVKGDLRRVVGEAMEKTATAHVESRIIGQLSKGYRQRVGLADCLLGDPKLLILDEPTVGLDPNQVVETRNLIREIGRSRTVFLSTHILHEVEQICSRVVIIHEGRIVAEGNTGELCRTYGGNRKLTLELSAPAAAAGEFRAIAAVVSAADEGEVGGAGGMRRFCLECDKDNDPRVEIAALCSNRGWVLQEMRLEPVRLEEIFTRLTSAVKPEGSQEKQEKNERSAG